MSQLDCRWASPTTKWISRRTIITTYYDRKDVLDISVWQYPILTTASLVSYLLHHTFSGKVSTPYRLQRLRFLVL